MERRSAKAKAPPRSAGTPADHPPADARSWRDCLVHRRYLDLFDPAAAGQYSVRIAQEGTGCYFPLGTSDETVAAAQASLIFRAIRRQGWSHALQHYPREFTLALFWCNN